MTQLLKQKINYIINKRINHNSNNEKIIDLYKQLAITEIEKEIDEEFINIFKNSELGKIFDSFGLEIKTKN